MKWPVIVALGVVVATCGCERAAAPSPSPSPSPSSPATDEVYETVTNIERVVFRFPVPTSYVKEEPSGVRAKKVFVSQDKKTTVILQGILTDRSLAELHARDRGDITQGDPTAKIALDVLQERASVLSWTAAAGQRIHYVKKWLTDDKDVVMAAFDYPVSERARFDRVIPKVVAGFATTP